MRKLCFTIVYATEYYSNSIAFLLQNMGAMIDASLKNLSLIKELENIENDIISQYIYNEIYNTIKFYYIGNIFINKLFISVLNDKKEVEDFYKAIDIIIENENKNIQEISNLYFNGLNIDSFCYSKILKEIPEFKERKKE